LLLKIRKILKKIHFLNHLLINLMVKNKLDLEIFIIELTPFFKYSSIKDRNNLR